MENSMLAVIGAGIMGNGIAQVMAASGHDVVLSDINGGAVQRGLAAIGERLDRLVRTEKLSKGDRDATLARIKTAIRLDDLADCDVVVEAATESVQLKLKIFTDLDGIAKPEAILASDTASISSLTRIAAATRRPTQVIGMHFFSPAPVTQVVEIIRALQTADSTYDAIKALTQKLGKTPVYRPFPLWREMVEARQLGRKSARPLVHYANR